MDGKPTLRGGFAALAMLASVSSELDSLSALRREVQAAIDRHWGSADDPVDVGDLDITDRVRRGELMPTAWVLVVSAEAITGEPTWLSTRFTPDRQSPFTSIGLLSEQIDQLHHG